MKGFAGEGCGHAAPCVGCEGGAWTGAIGNTATPEAGTFGAWTNTGCVGAGAAAGGTPDAAQPLEEKGAGCAGALNRLLLTGACAKGFAGWGGALVLKGFPAPPANIASLRNNTSFQTHPRPRTRRESGVVGGSCRTWSEEVVWLMRSRRHRCVRVPVDWCYNRYKHMLNSPQKYTKLHHKTWSVPSDGGRWRGTRNSRGRLASSSCRQTELSVQHRQGRVLVTTATRRRYWIRSERCERVGGSGC